VLEVFLLVPAAVAAGAALLGANGAVEAPVAVRAAVAAVILAGASVLFDIPARAQRAEVGTVYLEAFVAQTADVPESDEALTDLRRWFVRINAALLMGALQVDPLLLVPSPGSEFGPMPVTGPGDQRRGSDRRPRAMHELDESCAGREDVKSAPEA
jgi:hypothetical protein